MLRGGQATSFSYLFLLLVSITVASILITGFLTGVIPPVSRAVVSLPSLSLAGEVSGAYVVKAVNESGTVSASLTIVVSNTGRKEIEVALIAVFSSTDSEDVINLLSLPYSWVYEDRYIADVVQVNWLSGIDRRALLMRPESTAALRVYSVPGIPSKVMACTETGCTELTRAGAGLSSSPEPQEWFITEPGTTSTSDVSNETSPSITTEWGYHMNIYGGDVLKCFRVENGVQYLCGKTVACCGQCECTDVVVDTGERGVCGERTGQTYIYSSAIGAPPTVAIGFYRTDDDFSFAVPKRVRVGRFFADLYGFNSSSYPQLNLLPSDWMFPKADCFKAELVLRGSIKTSSTLAAVWPDVPKVYIYIAGEGWEKTFFGGQQPSVRTFRASIRLINVTIIKGSSALKSYLMSPGTSFQDMVTDTVDTGDVTAVEITVVVDIECSTLGCFAGGYCGDDAVLPHINFSFYVELIPSTALSSG